ncbi:MAG: DNA polymerase III subunit delta' [Coriobacteriales bacterium]|jgi:DNA polymerase-3 subunit delta'
MSAVQKSKAEVHNPFESIVGQSQVSRFLAEAQREDRFSHAYLFVGPVGSGKTETAMALAKARLCPVGGCGECDTCRRISRRTHPDVHWVEPEGVGSYLTEQIREVIKDTTLAPIRANHKVYIITRADLLREQAANAFLKTLEEPPEDTSFILMSRTRDSVLQTLVSRCQTLVFRRLPDAESIGLVCRMSGASEQDAKIALATVGGSTKKACEFLVSPSRKNLRLVTIDVMERLSDADGADVIDCAKSIIDATDASQAEVKAKYEAVRKSNEDFMSKASLGYLKKMQDRSLKSSVRDGLMESFAVIRSWLRDCAAVIIGCDNLIVNGDCHYTIEKTGRQMKVEDFTRAEAAIDRASARIACNVTPQLVVETMLFEIRKVLYAKDGSSN